MDEKNTVSKIAATFIKLFHEKFGGSLKEVCEMIIDSIENSPTASIEADIRKVHEFVTDSMNSEADYFGTIFSPFSRYGVTIRAATEEDSLEFFDGSNMYRGITH